MLQWIKLLHMRRRQPIQQLLKHLHQNNCHGLLHLLLQQVLNHHHLLHLLQDVLRGLHHNLRSHQENLQGLLMNVNIVSYGMQNQ